MKKISEPKMTVDNNVETRAAHIAAELAVYAQEVMVDMMGVTAAKGDVLSASQLGNIIISIMRHVATQLIYTSAMFVAEKDEKLRQEVIKEFFRVLHESNLDISKEKLGKKKEESGIITFKNGSRITLAGTDTNH